MAEYIDVLDEKGNPTGVKKTYADIHRDGDRHRVMHVWILSPEGELLLQRRSPTKVNHPNQWDISVAGHIDSGESALDAAVLEAKEELGIDVKKENMRFLFTVDSPRNVINRGTYIDHEFQDVYLIRMPRRENFAFHDKEVAEAKWMPWQELETILGSGDPTFVPHTKEYEGLFAHLRSL